MDKETEVEFTLDFKGYSLFTLENDQARIEREEMKRRKQKLKENIKGFSMKNNNPYIPSDYAQQFDFNEKLKYCDAETFEHYKKDLREHYKTKSNRNIHYHNVKLETLIKTIKEREVKEKIENNLKGF